MSIPRLGDFEVWLVPGSQHLYGPEAIDAVAEHASVVAKALDASAEIPVRVVAKPPVTTPEEVRGRLSEADRDDRCVGVVAWMHTFSPAKMWIEGLRQFRKPLLHLHTQFSREIPWSTIDMDFMNLNQSAHGGREFGFICTRLGVPRKVAVGHWEDTGLQESIGQWCRAAAARHDLRTAKIARIGDNMREVAVTEGDKVAAQETFGFSVNGYGVSDVTTRVAEVSDAEVDRLCAVYADEYEMTPELAAGGDRHESLRDAARIEVALRGFLAEGGFSGFTDTFEDLGELRQLPGIAVQRLMAEGYGFGAEGDWKAAAMVRAAKVMAEGLSGGTSFIEDYTYHLPDSGDALVLGAHMLEICPSIAAGRPSCEIHPLGIGGKEDPVRLVFDAPAGDGVNATLIDMGDHFRMVANAVEVIDPPHVLPNLPVARAVWKPLPDLERAAAAWIYAGGSHHPVFSQALSMTHIDDFAAMLGIDLHVIDEKTELRDFRRAVL